MFRFPSLDRWVIALGLAAAPGSLGAQQGGIPVGPDGEPLAPPSRRSSAFNLFSSADYAVVTVNPGHAVENCFETKPGTDGGVGCPYGDYNRTDGVGTISFRNNDWIWGVPPSEWNKARARVPSLSQAKGGGYSVMTNVYTNLRGNQVYARDGSLGTLHNNITFGAGGCAASIAWRTTSILPAYSTCEATWGPVGWIGAQDLPRDLFLARFNQDRNGPVFDFWQIPGSYATGTFDPDRALGAGQTYGVFSDWSTEKAQAYGSLVPSNPVQTAPNDPGWPLGLEVRSDAFKFDLPTLRNITFLQTIIYNNSQALYGVGLDYDSLYIGWNSGAWFHSGFQNSGAYVDLKNGAYKSTISGVVKSPPCNGKTTITDIVCGNAAAGPIGDQWGAHAIVILKSPIGDLRNKLFTRGDASTNAFYNPSHPNRGDTITFNHFHMCGFRQCNNNTFQRIGPDPDGMQRAFGMISSIESDVRGARPLASLSDANYWHTFRSERFPDRSGGFNKYDIPTWGSSLGYTRVHLDPCGRKGCVAFWSDTLPNDGSHPGYINAYNNTGQVHTVGPIHLAAGDTVSFIMAFATSRNSKDEVDAMIERIVNTYMNFFLTPKAPPPPGIRAVSVNPTADPRQRNITLFLSLEPIGAVDPFLQSQAETFASGDAATLNPTLAAALRNLAANNIRAIHIFKSCDNGTTYTIDANCTPSPVDANSGGRFAAVGWEPAFTFEVERGVPTTVVDTRVTPGRTYNYVAVAETHGAEFVVLSRGPTGIVGENVEFAPVLFNTLSNNTDLPNVVRVRLPATLSAGSQPATATFSSQLGLGKVGELGFEPLSIVLAGTTQLAGDYRLVFGDSVRVVTSAAGTGGTTVTLFRSGTAVTFTSNSVVTTNGLTTTTSGGQTTARGTTLTAVLLDPSGTPLLVTRQLTGADATPGQFAAAPGFPGFFLNISNRPGQFAEQFYTVPVAGGEARMDADAQPSIVWSTATVVRRTGVGEYLVDFAGPVFGPLAPFNVNFANPAATQDQINTSLATRDNVSQTVIPTAEQIAQIAARLRALNTRADSALANRIAAGASAFQQASLPFTIRNVTLNRDVQVAMLKRTADTRTLTIGGTSATFDVPPDQWLPADTLFLIENGEVTWVKAVLECSVALAGANTCNPVPAPPITNNTPAVFVSPQERHTLHVRYFTGFDATSEFLFALTPVRTGEQLTAAEIREALRRIRVVPNPYLYTDLTDAATEQRVMFTNLPAAGSIRIYSLAGQFLQRIVWEEGELVQRGSPHGDLYYNLRTHEGNLLASGLYLFVVSALDGNGREIGQSRGKFVIIR